MDIENAGIKWSPLEFVKLNAEIVISVAFRISHQSIFCNKFHHNQLQCPLACFCPLEHFLVDKET